MTRRVGPVRTEAGATLVEVLVTVAILGIGVVSVVAGMGTSIIGTDHHRKEAQAHTVLLSAVDVVKSQPYQVCATSYVASTGVTLPSDAGWTASAISVPSVTYWNTSTSTFTASCPSPDSKLQLVTVRVTSPAGRAVESVSVVKRNPA